MYPYLWPAYHLLESNTINYYFRISVPNADADEITVEATILPKSKVDIEKFITNIKTNAAGHDTIFYLWETNDSTNHFTTAL